MTLSNNKIMKKIIVLLVALLCLSSCNTVTKPDKQPENTPALSPDNGTVNNKKTNSEISIDDFRLKLDKNIVIAVSYIGMVEYTNEILDKVKNYAENNNFKFLKEIKEEDIVLANINDSNRIQVFVIVLKDQNTTLAINHYDISNGSDKVYYRSDEGNFVVLATSDNYYNPDIEIVSVSQDDIAQLYPAMALDTFKIRNFSMNVYDFTDYEALNENDIFDAYTEMKNRLLQHYQIKDLTASGKQFDIVGETFFNEQYYAIWAIGDDISSELTTDKYYAINLLDENIYQSFNKEDWMFLEGAVG